MAETTPLGFVKPSGSDLIKTGDNTISTNAQKSQELFANTKARLSLLEQAAGFPEDPIILADEVVQGLVSDHDSATVAVLDATYAPVTGSTAYADKTVETTKLDKADAIQKWKATTAYTAGSRVLNPSGDVVIARATFTSGASYNPANWWLVRGDTLTVTKEELTGLTNVTPSLRAASDYCIANGIKVLQLPAGTFDYQSRWFLNMGTINTGLEVRGRGEATVFRHTGGASDLAFIHALGTDSAKAALAGNLPAGSRSGTFPTAVASALAKGDVIGFESTLPVFDVNDEAGMIGFASELRYVAAVSGTTVTFDGPTIWDYNTSNSAVVWKMNPVKGLKLSDFVITSSDPLINKWKGIQISKATNVVVNNVTFRDAGGGLFLYDCLDAVVQNLKAERLPNYTNYLGYGICVAGRSANVLVDNIRGHGTRHVFTTLSDERAGVHWGGPRNVRVRDGVGEAFPGSYTVWDTHPHGYDVTFENCHATGGVAGSGDSCGFQIRSIRTQIINGITHRMGAGGVRIHTMASNVDIVGGEFAYAEGFGITASESARVKGAWIHHNGSTGVIFGPRATKAHVTGCLIEENALSGTGHGIHDQSTVTTGGNVIGPGNIIPKSTFQLFSVLSPKNDTIIYGNITRGYGAGLDGVGGTVGGSVVRTQNITD